MKINEIGTVKKHLLAILMRMGNILTTFHFFTLKNTLATHVREKHLICESD